MCIAESDFRDFIITIYFPLGNKATGFFVLISLLAGVVGMITSLTGLSSVSQWNAPNLLATADSSHVTLSLTIFAMGYINYSSLFYFSCIVTWQFLKN